MRAPLVTLEEHRDDIPPRSELFRRQIHLAVPVSQDVLLREVLVYLCPVQVDDRAVATGHAHSKRDAFVIQQIGGYLDLPSEDERRPLLLDDRPLPFEDFIFSVTERRLASPPAFIVEVRLAPVIAHRSDLLSREELPAVRALSQQNDG